MSEELLLPRPALSTSFALLAGAGMRAVTAALVTSLAAGKMGGSFLQYHM